MTEAARYLESIRRGQLDVQPVTFEPARIGAYRDAVEQAEIALADPGEEMEDAVLREQLEVMRAEYEKATAETPPMRMIFVKISDATHDVMAKDVDKLKTRTMRDLIKSDGKHCAETVKESLENDALFATLGGSAEDYEHKLKDLLVEAVMELEGQTAEALSTVDDDDPEMKLSEAEEATIQISEAEVGLDRLQAAEKMDQAREQILAKRRSGIVARRLRELPDRRKALEGLSVDDLVQKIAYLKLFERMVETVSETMNDMILFYEACDPDKPITRDGKLTGYARKFDSYEQVTDLRKAEDELYAWLVMQHTALDVVPGTEALMKVAEYEPFCNLMETLSKRARPEQAAPVR